MPRPPLYTPTDARDRWRDRRCDCWNPCAIACLEDRQPGSGTHCDCYCHEDHKTTERPE